MSFFGSDGRVREYFLRAAIAAGAELGVFAALAAGPRTAREIAEGLSLPERRLRALLDVLVLDDGPLVLSGARSAESKEGVYGLRGDSSFDCAQDEREGAQDEREGAQDEREREGWGRLAEVIRRDRPLEDENADEGARRRFHEHLATAGAEAARELARMFACEGTLIDAGAGAGAYTKAFLEAGAVRATVVDRAEVIVLARELLAETRVDFVAGDVTEAPIGAGHAVALCVNLLHLHPPEICARIVERLAASLRPGGVLVVKDLAIEADRSGPPSGVLFALNMALYTDGGDVYDAGRIRQWLLAAGLRDVEVRGLKAEPEAMVVSAFK